VIVVRPEVLAAYPVGGAGFTVIAEHPWADVLRLPDRRPDAAPSSLIPIDPDTSLATLLTTEVPPESDVLVLGTGDRLFTAPADVLGPSRVVVGARVGEGPLAHEQLRHLLTAMEHTRPHAAARHGGRLLSALREPGGLTLHEPLTRSVATLEHQGTLRTDLDTAPPPHGVHMAPGGRLVAGSCTTGTPLTGTVAVKGRPVVTGGDRHGRQDLYERLLPLLLYPMVLTIEHGTVTALRAVGAGSDGAATALEGLFMRNPAHRSACAVFALNTALAPLPYNTEANTASAGRSTATFQIRLGDDGTPYRVTLPCAATAIHASDGAWLAGAMPRSTTRPALRVPARRAPG
jgi:hypothetical protein